jgi:hypothetical protein
MMWVYRGEVFPKEMPPIDQFTPENHPMNYLFLPEFKDYFDALADAIWRLFGPDSEAEKRRRQRESIDQEKDQPEPPTKPKPHLEPWQI